MESNFLLFSRENQTHSFFKPVLNMKQSTYICAFLAIILFAASVSAETFTSILNGAQALQANNSTAAGIGSVILNAAETNITVTVYFSGLSSAQTSSRIVNLNGSIISLPNGNFSQTLPVSPIQVADLKAGVLFFNIGTANFPSGEIRGQISPSPIVNPVAFPSSNGSLDVTFGTGGIVTTDVGGGNNPGQAVAIQADGKIVVGGYSRIGANDDFTVARYNPNGTLDTSFDGDGIVTTPVGPGDDQGLTIGVQPDGKIILAGQSSNGTNTDIAAVRYNSNGSLDTSFDGDGIVTTPVASGFELVRSIAFQIDGKIVVAGQTFNLVNNDIVVVRYNSDGSLDSTFDGNSGIGNGIVTTAVGSGNDLGYGVAIQNDGRIVVAGYYFSGTTNDAVLLRYDTNGVLDTTFDGDGIVTTAVGVGTDENLALTLQPDGKIVTAGCINQNGIPNDFLVLRFNTNGSLDTSFGTNGSTIVPIGTGVDIALAVAVQTDGKIVAAGFSNNGVNNDFGVIRLNPNGSLDATFDGDGRLTTPIGTSTDQANGIAIQADGKIVVAGRAIIGSTTDFGIVRYGFGTNAAANDGFFDLNSSTAIRFDNAYRAGGTWISTLNPRALPPIPNGLNLLMAPRNIQSTAGFSGDVLVRFTLPIGIDSANFNAAQILQFENGAWIDRTASSPTRDFATRTLYARATSLSIFAIVSPLAQSPQNGTISGRMSSFGGRSVSGAVLSLTDANGQIRYALTNQSGYFRFRDVLLRDAYLFNATSKRFKFSPQILTLSDETDVLNFTALP